NAELAISLVDADGRPAEFSPEVVSLPVVKRGTRVRRQIAIKVQHPLSWNAEQPRLYRLTATLLSSGRTLEQIERRIGFREIEVDGDRLLVNGRPVKLRGANRHLAHPLQGRSLTPQLSRQDAELLKEANCNFVRTSHYPPSEEFIAACDELGLYVEEEAPFCFFSNRRPGMTQDDVTRYAVYANLKMVGRDFSHPSVVIWSIGNESTWGPHFEAAAQAVARADPSRPRTFMWFNREAKSLTVAAEHYPGPDGVTRVKGDRPTLFSEFCHLPAYAPHEMYTDPGVDDQWGRLLAKTWANLYETPGALGGAIWCGVDDVFHLPPTETDHARLVRGVAAWGLVDGWRRPKPEYWHTKKVYSPVRVTASSIEMPTQGEPVRIPVANHFDFTNLADLAIQWRCGESHGTVTADIPPQSQGELVLDSDKLVPGQPLRLCIVDQTDRIVDEYSLPITSTVEPTQPETSRTHWTLIRSSDAYTVSSHHVVVRIDRATGKIIDASVDGRRVLQGGPHLAFVPTLSKHQQRAMKNETPRLTPVYGTDWQATSVTANDDEEVIEVRFNGRYKEAAFEGSYRFLSNGEMVVAYRTLLNRQSLQLDDVVQAVKQDDGTSRQVLTTFSGFQDEHTALVRGNRPTDEPTPVPAAGLAAVPRQLGLRFELPETVDSLAWERNAQWSVYPDDHIGRPIGTARAFLPNQDTKEALGRQPTWAWSQSACPLGTRDFRSTKHNIYRVSLTDAAGRGVEAVSDGSQHSRSYVHEGRIHWLIADLDNGPSETFMSNYFDPHRTSVPLGRPFCGTVRLRFLGPRD
ncbi:MAG TPA: glycoside hydrolase family 2 TIM barrel-domain containing protein, partial [Thermoguttaceae bacterium]|nr:glycoside hydrolase family 2 TIM barrel-domain containing protein [Thermoguttaceae bacterium]